MDRRILVASSEIGSSDAFALPSWWGRPISRIVETGAIQENSCL